MAKDVRALREEAAEATASGKYKRALAAYLELERLEPREAQWAKRAGETYRRLGNNKHAIEAFERSADRYAQNGFLVQAIAVCKLVLQIDPNHAEALRRLASMNEQLGAGPTRAGGMAENNPALHENPNVNAIRRNNATINPRTKSSTRQPTKEQTGRVPIIRDSPLGAGSGATPTVGARQTPAQGLPVASRTATPIPRAATNPPGTSSASGTMPTQSRPAQPAAGPVYPRPTSPVGGTPVVTPQPTKPQPAPQPQSPRPAYMPMQPRTPAQPHAPSSPPQQPQTPSPPPQQAQSQPQPQVTRPGAQFPRAPTPMPEADDPPPPVSNTHRMRNISPPGMAPLASPRSKPSTPPVVATPRTKSKPIALPPDAALDQLKLANEVPSAQLRDQATPGIHVIPLDDEGYAFEDPTDDSDLSGPVIEVEPPDEQQIEAEVDDFSELELDDLEEIPLAEPLYMGVAAHKALQATPLFAGLPGEALEALVQNLHLVHLDEGAILFREGEPGDALYVIVEGEVSVQAEGPPRVEMARLGAGSFIGEVALMTDQPRSATVSAITNAELLRIDRPTLSRVLADHGDVLRAVLRFVRDRLVDRWMRTSPLFRPFDDTQRAELAAKFNFLEIEDGTRLIEAGSRPDGLYIVLAGSFIADRGGTQIATLGAGELIGETALLSNNTFKSNITARGKSLALHLPAGEFREIIMTHPHVLEYIGEHAEASRRLQIL